MASNESSSSGPAQWQVEYESALLETDRKLLFKKVEVAEAAILARREVLQQSPDGFVERSEIASALAKLRMLKKEILNF